METFRHAETISEMLEIEQDARKKMYLNEINIQYKKWKNANLEIIGNSDEAIKQKIKLYADYRFFLFSKKFRVESTFLRKRKLFETALSEFIYYLVKDFEILKNKDVFLERAFLPSSIKFEFDTLKNIKNDDILKIKEEKMRMVIGRNMDIRYRVQGRKSYIPKSIKLPFVSIEVAMVLDEWIMANMQNQVRKFRTIFPRTLFLLACEVMNSDFVIDLDNSNLNGIYVFQKQTTTMKRKEISFDVISAFLHKIHKHLSFGKEDLREKIESGILIG